MAGNIPRADEEICDVLFDRDRAPIHCGKDRQQELDLVLALHGIACRHAKPSPPDVIAKGFPTLALLIDEMGWFFVVATSRSQRRFALRRSS